MPEIILSISIHLMSITKYSMFFFNVEFEIRGYLCSIVLWVYCVLIWDVQIERLPSDLLPTQW